MWESERDRERERGRERMRERVRERIITLGTDTLYRIVEDNVGEREAVRERERGREREKERVREREKIVLRRSHEMLSFTLCFC